MLCSLHASATAGFGRLGSQRQLRPHGVAAPLDRDRSGGNGVGSLKPLAYPRLKVRLWSGHATFGYVVLGTEEATAEHHLLAGADRRPASPTTRRGSRSGRRRGVKRGPCAIVRPPSCGNAVDARDLHPLAVALVGGGGRRAVGGSSSVPHARRPVSGHGRG